MPTVIDSLIVELGLDPRGFTTGQRQAINAMGGLNAAATKTSAQVNATTGASVRQLLATYAVQFNNINQSLTRLGQQSIRSGNAVAHAGKTGSYGLLALASAGTAAFTAIKAVQGVYHSLTTTVASTAALGRTAAYAGVTSEFLSRFQIAANVATNADTGATGQSVLAIRQSIEALQSGLTGGALPANLEALSRLGVDWMKGSPDEIAQRVFETELPRYLSQMGLPQAIAFGSAAGLQRELTQFLHGGPGAVGAGIGRAASIGTTTEQTKAAQELQRSMNLLFNTWLGFVTKLQAAMSPALTQSLNEFSDWLDKFQNDPVKMKAVTTELGKFGTELVKFVKEIGTLVKEVGEFIDRIESYWKRIPGHAGYEPPKPPDTTPEAYDWRKPWTWLHGRKPVAEAPMPPAVTPGSATGSGSSTPGATTPGRSGWLSIGEMKAAAIRAGFRGEAASIIAATAMGESNGNPRAYNGIGENSYGITQVNANAHGPEAKEAFGNPDKAMQLAFRISKGGTNFNPWTIYKTGDYKKYLDEARRASDVLPRSPYAAIGAPGVKVNSKGHPYSASLDTLSANEAANLRASGDAIRSAMTSGRPWWGTRSSTNTSSTDIGNINVNTQATDANGIAAAIGGAIKNSMVVPQANTGLEY